VLSAAGPGDLAAAVTTRGAAHDDSPWLVSGQRRHQYIPLGVFRLLPPIRLNQSGLTQATRQVAIKLCQEVLGGKPGLVITHEHREVFCHRARFHGLDDNIF